MASVHVPQKRVLLVDDSKFVRTTFVKILSVSLPVLEAGDGEAAWQAIEADASIVMVFTDLDMPNLDGFELLKRIRGSKNARIRDLPVVVISGQEEEGNKQRARASGANDFISKSADAAEVLSRLDNVLLLARTSRELEASRAVIDRGATHDPLTGAFTPHYLLTEGRKHFAHARRHGGELSLMALRVDSYEEITRVAGKDVADAVLTRVAKLLMSKVRAEDSVARVGPATFMVLAAGVAAAQMQALSVRLRRELDEAKIKYRDRPLAFVSSLSVVSLKADPANSIEELMRAAVQRLPRAATPAPPSAPPPAPKHALPPDLERILQFLEGVDVARLGDAAEEFGRRLKRIGKAIQAKRR